MTVSSRRSWLGTALAATAAGVTGVGCAAHGVGARGAMPPASSPSALAPRASRVAGHGGAAPIHWRMATSWPTTLPLLHESAQDFCDLVKRSSGGRLMIELVDPSQHGQPTGLLQAVQRGEFDLAHTTAQYYAEQVPAIDFFTAIPFGLTPIEQQGWLTQGGGQMLFEQVLRSQAIVPLTAAHTDIQMGGWYRRPLRGPEDLRGLRVRIAGFPAQVMARLGAVPVSLPFSGIVPAFEAGRIDGADVVGPAIDTTLPLARFARFYLAPWHEPDVALHVFIHEPQFQRLPEDLREILRVAAQAAAMRSIARARDRNAVAWRSLRTQGIAISPLPPALAQALREATAAALDEVGRQHDDAGQVIASLRAYRARVADYSTAVELAVARVRSGD
ncbi:TRAP transporter substrate-binding protein [Roseateles amylovorans]|uniref:TRAP transporter substrate-binding protein DctP n=1 Tax=Roseateles amylovorans TaxID=2978473 RepID=A0ABY6B6L3_9BURK|nr:TRAP transporter substrate-binding protein DctP [Roseateles amylovorans]UXH79973.1 TRAP transporter substrate-binding protein DctP [Roseateles amylovorans]